jgi:hypothetical protein
LRSKTLPLSLMIESQWPAVACVRFSKIGVLPPFVIKCAAQPPRPLKSFPRRTPERHIHMSTNLVTHRSQPSTLETGPAWCTPRASCVINICGCPILRLWEICTRVVKGVALCRSMHVKPLRPSDTSNEPSISLACEMISSPDSGLHPLMAIANCVTELHKCWHVWYDIAIARGCDNELL